MENDINFWNLHYWSD